MSRRRRLPPRRAGRRGLPHRLTLAVAAALAVATGGRAEAAYDQLRQSLRVEAAAESRADAACVKLAVLISAQLRARGRFGADHGSATHRATVACGTDKLTFRWYFKGGHRGADPVALVRVAAPDGLDANLETLAFKAAFDVLRQLPWDGELLGPKPGLHLHEEAFVSVGSLNSELIGNCLPIVVGRLRPGQAELFEPVGTGVIQATSDFDSEIEYYLRRQAAPKPGELLVFRFATPSAQTSKQRDMVTKCKRRSAAEDGALVALLRRRFSVDDLMVTSNKQGLGLALARLRADGGVSDPAVVGAYFSDRVGFGDYLSGTIDGFKDATSRPYRQTLVASPPTPLVALVQGYAMVNVTADAYRVGVGLGVIGDKANVPYAAPGNVGERTTKIRAGVFAAASGIWDDVSASVELGYGLTRTARYSGLRLTGDYRLFNTWFVGVQVRTQVLGAIPTTGEAGYTLSSVGLHLGFDLTK